MLKTALSFFVCSCFSCCNVQASDWLLPFEMRYDPVNEEGVPLLQLQLEQEQLELMEEIEKLNDELEESDESANFIEGSDEDSDEDSEDVTDDGMNEDQIKQREKTLTRVKQTKQHLKFVIRLKLERLQQNQLFLMTTYPGQ